MNKYINKVNVMLVKDRRTPYTVCSPNEVYAVAQDLLKDRDRETVLVFCIDPKGHVLSFIEVGVGILDSCMIHPREVFKSAILSNAQSIILVHNHPSGVATPSDEDNKTTKRIKDCGELLGITLRDHLIVTDTDSYYSYAEHGKL